MLDVKKAISNVSLGFTKKQRDDKGNQGEGNHLLEIILAFIHQFGQVKQVFTVSKSHFDFHTILEDPKCSFGFQAGDDPQGITQAFAPVTNQIDRDNTEIVDLAMDDRFAGSHKQLDRVAIDSVKKTVYLAPSHTSFLAALLEKMPEPQLGSRAFRTFSS
jgi:hypothetical protein